MPKSMTAFGRCEIREVWGELSCELRSVNHRYLEANIRMPEELRSLEPQIREKISQRNKRGKIECSLRLKLAPRTATEIELNDALAQGLINACQQLEKKIQNPKQLDALEILRWPGVVKESELDLQPMMQATLTLVDKVLDDFIASRKREGDNIRELLLSRCDAIEILVKEQRPRSTEVLGKLKEKLLARLNDLEVEPDSYRLEQELVYVAQKMDVDEELDRLDTHLKETRRALGLNEPVGRRLDFLMQEFNREANTLGSKSNDAGTTKTSVELKVNIEQMREQVQNLE